MAWPMATAGQWNPNMAMPPDTNMGSYTSEQWLAMQQQNWQQWAQWQQQYAQWQTQYGEKYTEQMQTIHAMGGMPPLPLSSAAPPPAPPPPDNPPPPPHENNQPLYAHTPVSNKPAPVPPPPGNQLRNTGNYNNTNTQPGNIPNWSYAPDTAQHQQNSVNADALKKLAEEERLFDIQFKKWEEEILKWKNENVNHPDKQAYKEYEDKFEACRAQLMERRQQMKLKRARLTGTAPQPPSNANTNPAGNIPPAVPPPTTNKTYPSVPTNYQNNNLSDKYHDQGNSQYQRQHNTQTGYNRSINQNIDPQDRYECYNVSNDNNYSSVTTANFSAPDNATFLVKSSSGKGIPGLDLVPEADKTYAVASKTQVIDISDDHNEVQYQQNEIQYQQQAPDYSTISKGINNILGDEKIMNILSMVRGQSDENNEAHNVGPPNAQYGGNNQNQPPYGQSNRNTNFNNQQFDNRQNRPNNRQGSNYPPQNQEINKYPPQKRMFDERQGDMPQEQYHYNRNAQYGGPEMPPFNDNGPPRPLMRSNMPGERPNLLGDRPNMLGDRQNLLGDRPNMPGNRPNLLGDRPNMPGNRPNLLGDRPKMPGDRPNLLGERPNMPSDRPNMPGDKPNLLGERPNMSGERPNLHGRPNMPGGRPNMSGPPIRPLMQEMPGPQNVSDYANNLHDRRPLGENNMNQLPPRPKWTEAVLFTPSFIVEYEHKPLRLKARDFIEPVHLFEYDHKSKDGDDDKRDFEKEGDELFSRKPRRSEKEYDSGQRFGRDHHCRDYERRIPRDDLREDYRSRVPPREEYDEKRRPDNRYDDRRRDDREKYTRREDSHKERDRELYKDRVREVRRDEIRANRHHSRSHERDTRKRALSRDSDLSSNSLSKKSKEKDVKSTPIQTKHVVMIDDLLESPGREMRPAKIVIILRGPPGSGKSYLAKLIRDREAEYGGTVRIMSIDDYFMQEGETEEKDPSTGKVVKKPTLKYEYDEKSEVTYLNSLKRAFKRTLTDGYFTFLIFDAVNDDLKGYADIWNISRQSGFQVYICTTDLDSKVCHKRNIHNRKLEDIEVICSRFFPTPSHHIQLDATTLLQSAAIPDVEMEDVSDEVIMEDAEETEVDTVFSSKWEKMDDAAQLARLDGTNKPLRSSQLSMEDYLQLDDWKPNTAKPGMKTVRWADIEERREQEKMRAIGFVVGQTDWNRMTDPTMGSSALTQTKYIERVRRN